MANFTANGNQKGYEKLFCSSELTGRTNKQLICLIVVNIFLSITASLGNTLILIALHKESFLHPPSKLLFRCLATTCWYHCGASRCYLLDVCGNPAMEYLSLRSSIQFCGRSCAVFSFLVDIDCHKCGQTSRPVVRAQIQRACIFKANIRIHNCFMDCLYCRFNNVLSKLLNDLKVWVYRCIIVDSYLNFLLRKNYSYSPSSSKSSTQSGSASRAEPKNSAEHIEMQKGSVQCTVAAVDISCLLSTF